MSSFVGKPPEETGVQHSRIAREGAEEASKVSRLPVQHKVVDEAIEKARTEAQFKVQQEVAEFLKGCHGAQAPTDVVIVYRNPDGSIGYSAPEGDGMAQTGMLDAAKLVMQLKMVGVLK